MDQIEEGAGQRDWERVRELSKDVLLAGADNSDAQNFMALAERALSGAASPPPASPTAAIEASPSQPASFANGRYLVKRFLGEGGKKKVYLAQDTTLDREVAFAVIKTVISRAGGWRSLSARPSIEGVEYGQRNAGRTLH